MNNGNNQQGKKETSMARFVVAVVGAVVSLTISILALGSLFVSTSQFVVDYSVWIFTAFFWSPLPLVAWCDHRSPVSKKQLHRQINHAKTRYYTVRERMTNRDGQYRVNYRRVTQYMDDLEPLSDREDNWGQLVLHRNWWRDRLDELEQFIHANVDVYDWAQGILSE